MKQNIAQQNNVVKSATVGRLKFSAIRRRNIQLAVSRPTLSIVIPVMNESENIKPLVARIKNAVESRRVEVLFVDDSKDQLSVKAVAAAQKKYSTSTFGVSIIHRVGEQRWGGLSGAVTDGFKAARTNKIIVMDGDLQHPPEVIPSMIEKSNTHDVVVASRYCDGGDAGGLDGMIRHLVSRSSTIVAKAFFPRRLKKVTDPMTGFFLIHKRTVDFGRLRPKGFKILLELLATHPKLTKAEVPLEFAERLAGESHGNLKQGLEFISQLIGLRFGTILRKFNSLPKTVQFSAIGGGVFAIGTALLYILVDVFSIVPLIANAVQLTLTFWLNYVLNRKITWRDRVVSKNAAYKFLISRAGTTVLNFLIFAALISMSFSFTLLGTAFNFSIHYILANVIGLFAVMVLNYVISDRWAFANANDGPRSGFSTFTQTAIALISVGLLFYIATLLPSSILVPAFLATVSIALFSQACIEVWRMMYSYMEPARADRLKFPKPLKNPGKEKFCLIVPARHEPEVLTHTLTTLAKQTHPDADIISVICDDDLDTIAAANRAIAVSPRISVIEFPLLSGMKPSKPLQLNYVLEQIADKGYTVVGIFDAEDTVHPELLVHIEAAFKNRKIDIVQGGVQLMNHDSSWYSLHNVLEYYRWFNSAMSFNSDQKFMPLGGNTIFIRESLLRKAGGWPLTLTEDCSLGVLLSTRFRANTAVYYDARLATREETPSTIQSLFKQRVRWNQGFFHEWRAGVWHELPSFKQRLLASYVLFGPVLMALISIFMVISLLAIIFVKAPVGLAMLMYLPLIPIALLSSINALFLYDFGKAFGRKITLRQYATLFVTQFVYQTVLNLAALWSVIRELRGDDSWYKTTHSGLHRDDNDGGIETLQPAFAMGPVDEIGVENA